MNRTRKTIPKCCICGKKLLGEDEFGNNPEPVKSKGRCCNACNWMYVIPARAEMVSAMIACGERSK